MSWGIGPWGSGSPWGTGTVLAVPTLVSVASEPDATAPTMSPAVVAEQGGTICRLFGTNFADPMTVEIGLGSTLSFTKLGEGYIFDPEFDLRSNRVFFGAPALERGLYSIRVVTAGGTSNVLEDVLSARLFAEEYKTISVRGKFSAKWRTGPRILKGST